MNLPDNKYRTGITVILCILFGMLSACGIASRTTYTSNSGISPETSHSFINIQKELYRVHDEWKGTPYVLGGSSSNGVDCSSFIQIVFDRHFGVSIPRNTREQIRVGDGIRRSSVRPGDLIFFRTTRRDLHVGIAVNEDEFLHASTSSGVMISNIGERYWATRFLGVRRIL